MHLAETVMGIGGDLGPLLGCGQGILSVCWMVLMSLA